jgi:xylulokinase
MAQGSAGRPALLGIDLGTSSVKVVVLDEDGQLLASTSSGYDVSAPAPGWAETDPASWWAAVVDATRAALAAYGGAPPVAIGLAGQMHGLVATGMDGRAVRPAMLWPDSRAIAELASYRALPESLRERLGNPLTPGMAGPMLAWLARNEPQTYAATRWALQPKDWLRAQLTGEFHAEPSDASATLLYDVLGDDWGRDLAAALGLDPALLAPLLPAAGQLAGRLTAAPAAELGLPAGTPVAAGAGDTAAAALGSGLAWGEAQLTIGTGVQVVTSAPAPTLGSVHGVAPVTHLYRAATDTGWYAMAAGLNGGSTLDWVRQLLGASWEELYASAAADPASDDPMFLPHLSGERTPYLDTSLRGAWIGLSAHHDRTALMRAALEGVAFAARDAMTPLRGDGAPLDQLRLAGGGTTDPSWRQLLADVLGARLQPVRAAGASARGAALLAARAADLLTEEEVLQLSPPLAPATVLPREGYTSVYDERFTAFHAAVSGLRDRSSDHAAPPTTEP